MHQAEERANELMLRLADTTQERFSAEDIAIVIAHPDDETIGCGAQLARIQSGAASMMELPAEAF